MPTHTALAVVSTDLALGALLWVGWHGLLAEPATWATPAGLRSRLPGLHAGLRTRLRSSGSAALIVLALAVGAATHVLWDEFTHPGRWGARHLGVLSRTWAGEPGYHWAQELSGVLGAVVLLVWLLRWWQRSQRRPAPPRPGWWAPWLALGAVGLGGGLTAAVGAPDARSAAVAVAFRGGGVLLAGVLVLAAAWRLRHRTG